MASDESDLNAGAEAIVNATLARAAEIRHRCLGATDLIGL